MSKQELARRIVRDMGYDYQTVRNIIDGIAFEGWLHDPDQVPGRTITERELYEVQIHCGFSGTDTRVNSVLRDLGLTVVPDPEPTNAEMLKADLQDIWDGNNSLNSVVQWLNDNGWTKAPEAGGDDEH